MELNLTWNRANPYLQVGPQIAFIMYQKPPNHPPRLYKRFISGVQMIDILHLLELYLERIRNWILSVDYLYGKVSGKLIRWWL